MTWHLLCTCPWHEIISHSYWKNNIIIFMVVIKSHHQWIRIKKSLKIFTSYLNVRVWSINNHSIIIGFIWHWFIFYFDLKFKKKNNWWKIFDNWLSRCSHILLKRPTSSSRLLSLLMKDCNLFCVLSHIVLKICQLLTLSKHFLQTLVGRSSFSLIWKK